MSTEILEEVDVKTNFYPSYKVIMLDDPKTPMDFVVIILMKIFNKAQTDAVNLMLTIHNTGQAIVGIYSLEQAEFKVEQVHSLARTQGFPLTCVIEKA